MQQRTCQKVDEDFSKQMWSSRIIQTLNDHSKYTLPFPIINCMQTQDDGTLQNTKALFCIANPCII